MALEELAHRTVNFTAEAEGGRQPWATCGRQGGSGGDNAPTSLYSSPISRKCLPLVEPNQKPKDKAAHRMQPSLPVQSASRATDPEVKVAGQTDDAQMHSVVNHIP